MKTIDALKLALRDEENRVALMMTVLKGQGAHINYSNYFFHYYHRECRKSRKHKNPQIKFRSL